MTTQQARARRGLRVYFALVVLLTGALDVFIIRNPEYDSALLLTAFVPGLSAIVARVVLREGFADVSFRLGGRRGVYFIALAPVFPLVVGLIAYGLAWSTGLAQFTPRPAGQLLAALALFTVAGLFTASGEEIGWRGYMLTRLIDAGVPRPMLASGLIWAVWHLPLVLAGIYAAGPSPLLSAVTVVVAITSAGVLFAYVRLATGSVWPAVALHLAWNRVIQNVFDALTTGPDAKVWVGESGIVTTAVIVVVVALWLRRRPPILGRPAERDQTSERPVGSVTVPASLG